MTGKKLRPRTEPMYSGGNRQNFPITSGYDIVDSIDFISGFEILSNLFCERTQDGTNSVQELQQFLCESWETARLLKRLLESEVKEDIFPCM